MQFDELGLNRFGFKSDPDPVGAGPVEMSTDNGIAVASSESESGSPEVAGAKEVITGSLITKCIVQSSNSANRVELSSFFNFNGTTIENDSLVTYANGEPVVIIDTNGISVDNPSGSLIPLLQINGSGYVDDFTATDLEVNTLSYRFEKQPQVFFGRIDGDGSILYLPFTGWSVTHLGTGRYQIDHNFGDTNYSVNINEAAYGGGALEMTSMFVDNISNNSFDVVIFGITSVNEQDTPFNFSVFREVS